MGLFVRLFMSYCIMSKSNGYGHSKMVVANHLSGVSKQQSLIVDQGQLKVYNFWIWFDSLHLRQQLWSC